jgi:hypothetical protein
LQAVNLFTKPLMMSDAVSLRDGHYKTYTFGALFGLSSIILVAFYATRETVFQQTFYKPSLAQYNTFMSNGWTPTCACATPPTYADGVELNVPIYANFSTNFCTAISALSDYLSNGTLRKESDSAALLYYFSLRTLSRICDAEAQATNLALTGFMPAEIGPTLMSEPSLTSLMTRSMVIHVDNGFVDGGLSLVAVASAGHLPPKFGADISSGALARSPENCSCNALVLANLPLRQAYDPCSFLPSFDVRNGSDPAVGTWASCNMDRNAVVFPMSLFLVDAFYEQFGVPPEVYQPLQRFPLWENVTTSTVFADLLNIAIGAYFAGSAGHGDYDFGNLRPGLITVTYDRYFEACAPHSCVVTYSDTPSAIQLITIMLGVISGLQTVLMLSVDRGYDWLCKAWCDRRALAARDHTRKCAGSSRIGDDDVDDSDEDSDGAPARSPAVRFDEAAISLTEVQARAATGAADAVFSQAPPAWASVSRSRTVVGVPMGLQVAPPLAVVAVGPPASAGPGASSRPLPNPTR